MVTFQWLNNLPRNAKDSAHFMCCSKINSGIIDHVRSKKTPKISIFSVAALALDVKHLESFAETTGVPQLKHCFDKIKVSVDAILNPEVSNDAMSMAPLSLYSKYKELDLDFLADIYEKMIVPSSSSLPANLPKLDRFKFIELLRSSIVNYENINDRL